MFRYGGGAVTVNYPYNTCFHATDLSQERRAIGRLSPYERCSGRQRDLDAGLNLKRPGFTNHAGGRLASHDDGTSWHRGGGGRTSKRGDAQRRGQESQSQARDGVRVAAARRFRVAISDTAGLTPNGALIALSS